MVRLVTSREEGGLAAETGANLQDSGGDGVPAKYVADLIGHQLARAFLRLKPPSGFDNCTLLRPRARHALQDRVAQWSVTFEQRLLPYRACGGWGVQPACMPSAQA